MQEIAQTTDMILGDSITLEVSPLELDTICSADERGGVSTALYLVIQQQF
jgi:hypothetical protein